MSVKVPVPQDNQDHSTFMQVCMNDTGMIQEFSDQTERSAQCHVSWQKNNTSKNLQSDVIHKQFDLSQLKDGEFVVMASDSNQDRDGDTISPDGWDLKNFLNNGAFLYSHDKDQFPVAKPLSYEINSQGQLLIKGKFADKGTSEFTDAVRALAEQGILKGVSVGFIGKSEPSQSGRGRHYIQQELIECSFTAVPANANCKLLTKDFSVETQRKLFQESEADIIQKQITELKEVIKAASIVEKSSIHVNRKAVAHAKSLVKAGKVNMGAWSMSADDENSLLGKDDWDTYSTWFLAIDTSATPKTKAYYKYPFGKDGEVYRRGVIAAKSRAAQQGESAVSSAADSILQMIDKDKKEQAIRTELSNKNIDEETLQKLLTICIEHEDSTIWVEHDTEDENNESDDESNDDSSDSDISDQLDQILSLLNGPAVSPDSNDSESAVTEAKKQEETKVVEPASNSDAEEKSVLNRIFALLN